MRWTLPGISSYMSISSWLLFLLAEGHMGVSSKKCLVKKAFPGMFIYEEVSSVQVKMYDKLVDIHNSMIIYKHGNILGLWDIYTIAIFYLLGLVDNYDISTTMILLKSPSRGMCFKCLLWYCWNHHHMVCVLSVDFFLHRRTSSYLYVDWDTCREPRRRCSVVLPIWRISSTSCYMERQIRKHY